MLLRSELSKHDLIYILASNMYREEEMKFLISSLIIKHTKYISYIILKIERDRIYGVN